MSITPSAPPASQRFLWEVPRTATRLPLKERLPPFRTPASEAGCPPSGSHPVEWISPPGIRGYVPAFDGLPEWKRRAVEDRDIPPEYVPNLEKIRVTGQRTRPPR
jgi:hypothetical protein